VATGNALGTPIRVPGTTLACVPEGGVPKIWLQRTRLDVEGPRGFVLDEHGVMSASDRPEPCRLLDESVRGTFDSRCQTSLSKKGMPVSAMRYDALGLAETPSWTSSDPDERLQIGYDPKTCAVRWKENLPLTTAALHERPNLRTRVSGNQIVSLYQLASGGWVVGARELGTGRIIWHRDLPQAERGTNFEEIYLTDTRAYVALDWKLEVLARDSGELLGSI
jgi:hypothetical protein